MRIVAVLVDLSDLFLRSYLSLGGVRDYQAFDKWLDQVYMLTFLITALRWPGRPRQVAVGLYAFRMVGFAAFEATTDPGNRDHVAVRLLGETQPDETLGEFDAGLAAVETARAFDAATTRGRPCT